MGLYLPGPVNLSSACLDGAIPPTSILCWLCWRLARETGDACSKRKGLGTLPENCRGSSYWSLTRDRIRQRWRIEPREEGASRKVFEEKGFVFLIGNRSF